MSKYEPLTQYLVARPGRRLTMTFAEIERVVGARLPASRQRREWWSNNPHNNVMTRAWLAAGFKTADVDIAEERLTFVPTGSVPPSRGRGEGGTHPARGALRGTATWSTDVDLTEPVDAQWEAVSLGPAA